MMSACCAPGSDAALAVEAARAAAPTAAELTLASHRLGDGTLQSELAVPDVHCGACIATVERGLAALPGVVSARVNLSSRRVTIRWHETARPPIVETLERLGYPAHLLDPDGDGKDRTLAELVRAVAVAGFSAGNIMLLSVSVWSGADAATRDLFHWISALIAIPALAYSGRIFYRSAFRALAAGRTNMDVPIAIGVTLAYAMSLYETVTHGEHAYFDAAVSLLFFLLIGRTLDHLMRAKTRTAVEGLVRLQPRGALVEGEDGVRSYLPVADIRPGMRILLAAGERVPVDAAVVGGRSDIDASLVSGESALLSAAPGTRLQAGMLNLSQPLTLVAEASADRSLLAEMVRLMEAAESGRARYRRIADRAAALYAPVVHLTALIAFVFWFWATGDWHRALTIAVAVLIITCPCALGLAVPIVQVVAARRLFERGIFLKDGAALERLAEVDTAVFDKTGTLTLGRPQLVGDGSDPGEAPATLSLAAALAAHSRHPYARALVEAAEAAEAGGRLGTGLRPTLTGDIRETPGCGVEATFAGRPVRLGRAAWAAGGDGADPTETREAGTVLAIDGRIVARFSFTDALRPQARSAIEALRKAGLAIELLSGDRKDAVQPVADALGIVRSSAGQMPAGKTGRLATLAAEGHRTLMVGDGLNDAPALAAAHVSMAPASAADIGRNAADFVFLHAGLEAVPFALSIARRSGRLVRQNFALAIGYNMLAVPIAVTGLVTPLVAAVAMSLSSVVVVANAMRLMRGDAAAFVSDETPRAGAATVEGRTHAPAAEAAA